jgi:uncharacterized paraquat-inducible protein A
MALITCSECQGSISPRAWACPKCGEPMKVWRRRILYGCAGAVLVGFCLFTIFYIALKWIGLWEYL